MLGEVGRLTERLRILPRRILAPRCAHPQGPAPRLALSRAVRRMLARLQTLLVNVGSGEVVDRCVTLFAQEQHPVGVHDWPARQESAHALDSSQQLKRFVSEDFDGLALDG